MDSEWVHDRYNDNSYSSRGARPRRASPPRDRNYGRTSSKLRVENIHYDLTQRDLDDLFNRIGPVAKLDLLYDRAGRSEGVAYVTYESADDALTAIAEFDGANANGQPIRLRIANDAPSSSRRNPFDTAVRPGRSLEERITQPATSRDRSYSPYRQSDVTKPAPPHIDRYVPGQRSSRSPMPRRREGRPPGARRERGDRREGARGRENGARPARRPKKTQEELDAEMDDYWGSVKTEGNGEADAGAGSAPVASAPSAQVDMAGDIEMVQ